MDADALIDRHRLKRRLVFWRILAVAALALAALALLDTTGTGPIAGPHIARVKVEGIITDDPDRIAAIAKLADEPRVKAVIVRIDSPGGTATGGEALYRALRTVAEKKPVVAAIGTMGASAAYMTALAADRIVVRETSITGSIGVILEAPEMSGLLDRLGVAVNVVKSAPLKGEPSVTSPLTPEARASLQSMIDDSFAFFRDLVAERRKLGPNDLAKVADGRAFTGRQALALKLVDGLGGEAEAKDWLVDEKKLARDLPVRDMREPRDGLLGTGDIAGAARKVLMGEWLNLDGLVSVWHPRG
jgi:protease-4